MLFDELTEENFILYCSRYYDNPQCASVEEFLEDLKRVKYLKKLFSRYQTKGDLKERLILNHIIVLNNVFGPIHSVRILFFKIEEEHWAYLKPFLILLSIMPKTVTKGKISYHEDEIPMDLAVVEALRKI